MSWSESVSQYVRRGTHLFGAGRYWKDFNDYQLHLSSFGGQRTALYQQVELLTEQLNTLRSTNVFSDTFHIWADPASAVGTINRLRLGRLPTAVVSVIGLPSPLRCC